jgi:hypothetical protein
MSYCYRFANAQKVAYVDSLSITPQMPAYKSTNPKTISNQDNNQEDNDSVFNEFIRVFKTFKEAYYKLNTVLGEKDKE